MPYEKVAFEAALLHAPDAAAALDLVFVSARLEPATVSLAGGARAVCLFASDLVDAHVLRLLREEGVELVALRYAGISSVDLAMAAELGIRIARAPGHAPTSIAEYAVTLMLTLNRKVHVAASRVRDGNLLLNGLVGFDVANKTVGIIGTGKVGRLTARILRGFGCRLLAYDMMESKEVVANGGKYVAMGTLLAQSDILMLHAPLVPGTHHMIGRETLPRCKRGVHIVNTSRGGLIDVRAAIEGLRSGQIGALAMDVYEGESSLFFRDHTGEMLDVDFQLLKSMPNVIMTGHQAALTTDALEAIAKATVHTLWQFQRNEPVDCEVRKREPLMKIMRPNAT